MQLSPNMASLFRKGYPVDSLTSPNVIGVAVVGREDAASPEPAPAAPKTCSTGFTCPGDDGCSYTDGSRTLTLACGIDFYGGDFANEYSASLEACTQSCASNAQCVAAPFVGGKGAGQCYLKDAKNGGSRNDNVDGKLQRINCVNFG